jgi:hypothetical protein
MLCITQIIYMIANLLVLLSLQLLSNHFLKFVSHTHFFGYWRQIPTPPSESATNDKQNGSITSWSANRKPYSKGSVVLYDGKTYVAMGEHNYGVPGQLTDRVLFLLFCEKPDRSHCYLICMQSAVTLSLLMLFLSSTIQSTAMDSLTSVQNISLLRSRSHFELLSWEVCIIMLLFNYYICHLCVWVRKETLRFLLFLAQTTAPSPSTSTNNTNTTPVQRSSSATKQHATSMT